MTNKPKSEKPYFASRNKEFDDTEDLDAIESRNVYANHNAIEAEKISLFETNLVFKLLRKIRLSPEDRERIREMLLMEWGTYLIKMPHFEVTLKLIFQLTNTDMLYAIIFPLHDHRYKLYRTLATPEYSEYTLIKIGMNDTEYIRSWKLAGNWQTVTDALKYLLSIQIEETNTGETKNV